MSISIHDPYFKLKLQVCILLHFFLIRAKLNETFQKQNGALNIFPSKVSFNIQCITRKITLVILTWFYLALYIFRISTVKLSQVYFVACYHFSIVKPKMVSSTDMRLPVNCIFPLIATNNKIYATDAITQVEGSFPHADKWKLEMYKGFLMICHPEEQHLNLVGRQVDAAINQVKIIINILNLFEK